jgi:hypothetical protein
MECAETKRLLSEYIDGTLDIARKAQVHEHLLTCKDCQGEFTALSALVKELGSIESVEPPADFLSQLHARLDGRSWFSGLMRALFVPVRVKIPLEFASAAVAAILIFSVLNLQREEYKFVRAPAGLEQERIAEKSALDKEQVTLGDRAHIPSLASEEAIKQPGEGLPRQVYEPTAPSEAKKGLERASRKRIAAEEVIPKVTHFITLAQGKLIAVERDRQTQRPQWIIAEVPAKNYKFLSDKLERLGDIEISPKTPPEKDQDVVRVRILLPSPK